ncbi:MAG: hypothetical protein JXA07_01505 [Spirochaetes bacterium]|nr:hypothetical protein [Spirochaetota bacterium]
METTLNIHVRILEKISLAARSRGISRSEMIILLIKKAMDDIPDPARIGRMVRYQKRNMPTEWRTFHVRLRMDDYEFFLDLRKLLKMSVSLILAYAVKKFLDKLVTANTTDNYQYRNYVVIKEYIDSIVSWRFIWGYPPKIGRIIR